MNTVYKIARNEVAMADDDPNSSVPAPTPLPERPRRPYRVALLSPETLAKAEQRKYPRHRCDAHLQDWIAKVVQDGEFGGSELYRYFQCLRSEPG